MLSLIAVAQAQAAVTVIDIPDAAYQASTTKIDFSAAETTEEGLLTSISDGVQTVSLSFRMGKFFCPYPGGPPMWGSPPLVEASTNVDFLSVRWQPEVLTFSKPVKTFGFELVHGINDPGPATIAFLASAGGAPISSITKVVAAAGQSYNAQLFAITSDTPFDKVQIITEGNFAIGQIRYALAAEEPPVVSTPASSGWSIAVLAALAAALLLSRRPLQP